jgi:hypothetical protein
MDLSRAIALDLSKFKVLALQPDPWPCFLDRSHLCITNHSFDILAHGSQTHTEMWEIFAGTPKHDLVEMQRPDCWNVHPGRATTLREGV